LQRVFPSQLYLNKIFVNEEVDETLTTKTNIKHVFTKKNIVRVQEQLKKVFIILHPS